MAQAYITAADISRFGLNGYALEGMPLFDLVDRPIRAKVVFVKEGT